MDARKYASKLAGKHIMVFGGTSGIGFCVAEAALEQGASVFISSSNSTKLASALENLLAAYPTASNRLKGKTCDLSVTEKLEENLMSILTTATESSKIDHIVFTSGNDLHLGHVSQIVIDQVYAAGVVRFFAPIILAKLCSRFLQPGPESSITFTGGAGSQRPPPNFAIAGAYTAGLEGLVRGLAVDLKPFRVNLVAVGAVHTEMLDRAGRSQDGLLEALESQTTIGRLGRPEDVAEAYIYIMKDHFITGSTIETNGGFLLV
ncbi:hypothetical protein AnigIFM56816_005273 [Aspergillus niger]|uniref:NAD(P)-binding protein n=1 Tax=Aspergillus welwitschiae TaxID=1341132 RepID=A0A3F3PP65_9EURO|nr:hypothetical protein BDQ94DRAFT_151752 [Aspergillus welwitschiae]RDH28689.1 hypothetical protein BDQ94DRAFT_151752 [Aspergillus welwitschiae]GKZ76294.1 hypothetical protein AnigIFM56816_005273 [Aspergillus niger]